MENFEIKIINECREQLQLISDRLSNIDEYDNSELTTAIEKIDEAVVCLLNPSDGNNKTSEKASLLAVVSCSCSTEYWKRSDMEKETGICRICDTPFTNYS